MMPFDTHPFLRKLLAATNGHDLEALVDCFDPAYRNETPTHPGRGFQGHEQVRANWRQIFTFVPDIHADVPRWSVDGPDVWSEWEMSGTRLDGSRHLMRGVIIFGVQEGRASSARFYLEPVDETSTASVDDAVQFQVHVDITP
jgi:hypothetical protein